MVEDHETRGDATQSVERAIADVSERDGGAV